jgi:hypothetical protein
MFVWLIWVAPSRGRLTVVSAEPDWSLSFSKSSLEPCPNWLDHDI